MVVHDEGDNINLSDSDATLMIIQQSVLNLWETVNNLTRLRPKRLKNFYATIFGSARIQPDTLAYDDVRRLARDLSTMGCRIVTGGGPGLMQAANEGAIQGAPDDRDGSIGIRIQLPFEQSANAFVGQVYTHRTFFTRLHHFILMSDAFIVVPGGIGTALETFMVWQLLQVRKLYGVPLIMIGPMWEELVEWAKKYMVDVPAPLANDVDLTIPRCVSTVDEALMIVRERYLAWQTEGGRTAKGV
ncbi:MAG: LOG family protein [Planctomycetia bacterium]|nr:LOG family protein [Planctomycetia bacterium]